MKQSLFVTIALVLAMLFAIPVNAQRLVKYDSYYKYGNRTIYKSDMPAFLKQNCQEAYEQYSNKQLKIGWGVCIPSMAMLIGGAVMSFSGGNDAVVYTGIGFGAAGAAGLLTSIPFLSFGYEKRRSTCSVFNNQCGGYQAEAPIRFDLKVGPQSLGMAVNF